MFSLGVYLLTWWSLCRTVALDLLWDLLGTPKSLKSSAPSSWLHCFMSTHFCWAGKVSKRVVSNVSIAQICAHQIKVIQNIPGVDFKSCLISTCSPQNLKQTQQQVLCSVITRALQRLWDMTLQAHITFQATHCDAVIQILLYIHLHNTVQKNLPVEDPKLKSSPVCILTGSESLFQWKCTCPWGKKEGIFGTETEDQRGKGGTQSTTQRGAYSVFSRWELGPRLADTLCCI